MNPETKVTLEQIKAICARHNIPFSAYSRLPIGFTHEVHRLNDDLIIKFFNTSDNQHFKTESAMLALDLPFPKPTLIAKGGDGSEADRRYVIMTYIPGVSLGSCWHLATGYQRENLIKEICEALKAISQVEPAELALEFSGTWAQWIVKRGENLIHELYKKDILDSLTLEKARQTIRENTEALQEGNLYPVYWDVHFDNFIVSKDFKLEAIIDLENVELTALDYPLVVIQKQTDEPEKYLPAKYEKYANKSDYKHLKGWYRRYYPEMFEFDDLESRIRIYQLLDTLHLIGEWSHVTALHRKLDELLN